MKRYRLAALILFSVALAACESSRLCASTQINPLDPPAAGQSLERGGSSISPYYLHQLDNYLDRSWMAKVPSRTKYHKPPKHPDNPRYYTPPHIFP